MIYLINTRIIITNFLKSPQLTEISDYSELSRALFHEVYSYATSYNSDFLISYSNLKKLERYDTNHTRTHSEKELESRIKGIGKYKKKKIDFFILETSKKNFNEVCSKLVLLAKKNDVKIDYSTLTLEHLNNLKAAFGDYCSTKMDQSDEASLTQTFFSIKSKYNKSKIPNMNRLTANGLSRFDDWFRNGYVSYKHVSAFAKNDLKLPEGKADEKNFYKLFGYIPSDKDCFLDDVLNFIKKKMKQCNLSVHKVGMILEYYKRNKIGNDRAPYEYLLLGFKRNIDRQFLIYISLLLGLSEKEIKTLFKKANCVLTDFLKEDILLSFFAENDYLIDIKQRGALFNFLRESK